MTDREPRISLPRTSPVKGFVNIALKFRNSQNASITTWGQISEDAAKQIMTIITRDQDHRCTNQK